MSIVTITAVVGVLFLAPPEGLNTPVPQVEALIFASEEACRDANFEARQILEARGLQVRTLCLNTGVDIRMLLPGKDS